MSNYLGIDIGGTNTCYGIVNAEGEFLYENSIKTEEVESIEDLAERIYADVKKKADFVAIGIGAPSVNEKTQSIEFAPNLNWGDVVPLSEVFKEKFGMEVNAVNDANAAAIGEKCYGEAADMENFAVITLGTGIGLGMFINGEIVIGSNGLAGELGHTVVRRDGRECNCGNFGCLETYIAKEGIVRTAKEKLEFSSGGSMLNNISPSDLSPTEVFKAARKEDPVSLEVVDTVTRDLAFAISNIINILDVECVFLSGGISKNGNLLKRKTEKHLKMHVLPNLRDKSLLKISSLNDKNSGILGAVASIHSKMSLITK
ncbi:MAG: ROK family protein [Crocinitomix sp.]|nr:ROK family protein [Crocinitomix sp.]